MALMEEREKRERTLDTKGRERRAEIERERKRRGWQEECRGMDAKEGQGADAIQPLRHVA